MTVGEAVDGAYLYLVEGRGKVLKEDIDKIGGWIDADKACAKLCARFFDPLVQTESRYIREAAPEIFREMLKIYLRDLSAGGAGAENPYWNKKHLADLTKFLVYWAKVWP